MPIPPSPRRVAPVFTGAHPQQEWAKTGQLVAPLTDELSSDDEPVTAIYRVRPPVSDTWAPIVTRTGVPARGSLSRIDTKILTLSPALLEALRQVAPKNGRSWLRYVMGFAVVAILGTLAADESLRGFVAEKAREWVCDTTTQTHLP